MRYISFKKFQCRYVSYKIKQHTSTLVIFRCRALFFFPFPFLSQIGSLVSCLWLCLCLSLRVDLSGSCALVCALPLCPFHSPTLSLSPQKLNKLYSNGQNFKRDSATSPFRAKQQHLFPCQPPLELSSPFAPFFLQAHYETRQSTSTSSLCLLDPLVLILSLSLSFAVLSAQSF